MINPISI